MTNYQLRKWRGGFTLVEILTALVIFSVAIVAFLQAMGDSLAHQNDLLSYERAAMLAENIMEEIHYSQDFEEGGNDGQFDGADAAYHWETLVETTDIDKLMQVKVWVSWNEGGKEKDYELATLMARTQ